ncbi:phosphonate ABC transporter, permease protein PhnE [Enterococcus sp. HY326]|uniref:phosphonate ABC transporter, permease protein PhnE n=1 Tax=Enterococcus sp. HY326 TaxID=2971265 RepID=UPI002240BB06|nr:phosphonate ABC transporter, permease protein PhnE [Enterococcus sp. HY326]
MEKDVLNQIKKEKHNTKYILIITMIILTLFIWSMSALSLKSPSNNGIAIAGNIFSGILQPDLIFLFEINDKGVLYLLIETLSIAFLGTILGGVMALPLAFLSAKNLMPKPVAYFIRIVIMIIRTIPSFVYGLMFIRVTGPGSSAGVLTLGLISIGMLSKMFTETIEDLDKGILESMDAVGCTKLQKIKFGIVSQLNADFFSILLYRLDMNLRDASVLGLVGAGGIGAPLIFAMNAYKWNQVGSILIGLFILILVVELISSKIRNYLMGRSKKY